MMERDYVKRVLICYFSCTGNTKLACEYIKSQLTNAEVDLLDIRKPAQPNFSAYDLVGFATYTDWCDAPALMQTYLKALPKSQKVPTFLFNTCAGLSGKTLKTMHSLVEAKGYHVVAGFTLEAPESCPLLIVLGKTKEEFPTTSNLAQFQNFIHQLNQIMHNQKNPQFRLKLGLKNRVTPRFPRKTPKLFMGRKHVDENLCTKCGVCAQVCPYQAITMETLPVFLPGKCAGCWACFNYCPQRAIYTKRIKGRGHYPGPLEAYRKKIRISAP